MQSHENSGLLGERNNQQTNASIRGKRLVVVAIATVLVVLFVFAMDSSSSSGTLLTLGRKKEMTSLRVPALKKHKEHLESPLTTLYYLNQTSAFDRLETDGQSSSALDFFNYVQGGWDAQINQMFCPIASCAAVLNSLKGLIELPMDPIYSPFHWATQNNIVKTDCFKQLWSGVDKEEDVIVGPLRLDAAGSLLNCLLEGQGYTVQVIHMNPTVITKDEARDIIKEAVLDENSRVLINYDRGGIGQGMCFTFIAYILCPK